MSIFSRFTQRKLSGLLGLMLLALPLSARAGQLWEAWSRVCYSTDMTTEWLVADDKDWNQLFPPDKVTIYLLVPPVIKKVKDHWEITFDANAKVKKQLVEHFDSSTAYHVAPNGYHGSARNHVNWQLAGGDFTSWLYICSKNFWNGKRELLNVDPDGGTTPSEYNLDPETAQGICFLEPTVTEKDGEWTLTTKVIPDEKEKAKMAVKFADWMKSHPGPKEVKVPKIIYPPKMQKEYDAWWKALKEWQAAGANGLSPSYDPLANLTPEQQIQYKAWRKAETLWLNNGGEGPYPQPKDFVHEDTGNP